MWVFTNQLTLVYSYGGVKRRMSLMSSSLLNLHCPGCLVHFTWIVNAMRCKQLYNSSFVKYCFKDFFKILCSSHLAFLRHLVKVQVVQLCNSWDMATVWKNSCFILSKRLDFYIGDNLSIAVHINSTFNRWDITTKVYQLVYWF